MNIWNMGLKHVMNKCWTSVKTEESVTCWWTWQRPRKKWQPSSLPIPNGNIDTSIRVACTLRYFNGGSPYDIMTKYGVSHTELMDNVWYVVEAVNAMKQWYIMYPLDHKKQKDALSFKENSSIRFDVCPGAINGILIWIHKPMVQEAKTVGIDKQRFFVEESINLAWIARQSVMHAVDSWKSLHLLNYFFQE